MQSPKPMKKKKIDISFACDKSWDSMDKLDDLTRFCSDCKTNVVDYTNRAINGEKSKCGHFEASQLSNVLNSFITPKVGIYSMSLLAVVGITSFQQNLYSQTPKTEINVNNMLFNVSGIIKDKDTMEPLPFVSVSLFKADTKINTVHSDFDGNFSLSIDTAQYQLEDLQVVFNYIGYPQDTIKIGNERFELGNEKLIVELESNFDGIVLDTTIYIVNGRMIAPDRIITPSESDSLFKNMAPR